MAEKREKSKGNPSKSKKTPVVTHSGASGILTFLIPVLCLTFALFIPVLKNEFTNWDDIGYITKNPLLTDLSGSGLKAIFSTPVVSNYHPLTILTLAINYHLAELTPWSYHLTSIFLHVMNTALVFWFIMLLSGSNKWVSAIAALLFGIHPMHVESVAWISERKDLLYAMFYLGAMIVYVQYLRKKQFKHIIAATALGAVSLLCKPAAIMLPFSLLLLDYFFKRKWNWTWVLEKIPLFILSGIIAYVTVSIQSERAIRSIEYYSIIERICFAGFGLIWYLGKFIFPYPLSALHPFPVELRPIYYITTIAAIAGFTFLLFKVRNRLYHFAFGFYVINLLLVLQLISIGTSVVAERYTYVPYISLFFLLCMEVYNNVQSRWQKYKGIVLGMGGLWLIVLAIMTLMRIPVWKNSESLWVDVLKHYPENPRAWTNKSLYYFDRKEWPKAIEDLSNALKYDPHFMYALEWRARAYLETNVGEKALADAQIFHKLYPDKVVGLFILARSYEATNRTEEAVDMYNQLISKMPNVPEYTNNRGIIYFNKLKNYEEAKKDFEQSIRLNPSNGLYYLNLSRCYYVMNDLVKAKENAKQAEQLGATVNASYAKLIGLE